jgi:hypothetical protein
LHEIKILVALFFLFSICRNKWRVFLPDFVSQVFVFIDDYTVKKGCRFSHPSPAGMPLTKLSLAGNNLITPGQ